MEYSRRIGSGEAAGTRSAHVFLPVWASAPDAALRCPQYRNDAAPSPHAAALRNASTVVSPGRQHIAMEKAPDLIVSRCWNSCGGKQRTHHEQIVH
jgi:hypothetical protein